MTLGTPPVRPPLQAVMLPTNRRPRTGESVVISAKVNKLGSSIE